jgi:CHASE1-domain containing sensor protein
VTTYERLAAAAAAASILAGLALCGLAYRLHKEDSRHG